MTTASTLALIQTHLKGTLVGSVGDEAFQGLCQLAQLQRYEVPTQLCAAGERATHLYFVIDGNLELIARRASGEEFLIGVVSTGGWATWLNCFMDTPAEHDLCAQPGTTLIAIAATEVRRFCERHPSAYPLIIQHIGRRMRLVLEWTGQSAMARPAQRMAKLLHVIALEQCPAGNSATIQMTQMRLAAIVRCSRQTANALIAELQVKGLVRPAYRRYELPDLEKLAAFSSQDP